LNSFVMVRSRREAGGEIQTQTRFYISSLAPDAAAIAKAIRQHWGVENGLHWVMDVVFRDDECRIGKKNSPANFATVKHMAGNLLACRTP
jgi:predicted transposase YbfD/YdcC